MSDNNNKDTVHLSITKKAETGYEVRLSDTVVEAAKVIMNAVKGIVKK